MQENEFNGLQHGRSRRKGASASGTGAAGFSGSGEKAWKTDSTGSGEKAWKTENGGNGGKAWKTGKNPRKNSSLTKIRIRRLIVFAIL